MGDLRIEKGKGLGDGQFWLYRRTYQRQEVFLKAALNEQDMQALTYVPIEELFSGETIEGYAEIGETLYAPEQIR